MIFLDSCGGGCQNQDSLDFGIYGIVNMLGRGCRLPVRGL